MSIGLESPVKFTAHIQVRTTKLNGLRYRVAGYAGRFVHVGMFETREHAEAAAEEFRKAGKTFLGNPIARRGQWNGGHRGRRK
jgi:hypothetical protein